MLKYIDNKLIFHIFFLIGLLYFSFHYKDNIDQFDKNYMILTQQGYELDLKNNYLKDIIKESIIYIQFNNNLIINTQKDIKSYTSNLLKDAKRYHNYQKSFKFIKEYQKEFLIFEENIFQLMRLNAQINNSILYLQDQLTHLEDYTPTFRKELLSIIISIFNQKYDFGYNTPIEKESLDFFKYYKTDKVQYKLTLKHINLLIQEIPKFKNLFLKIKGASLFNHIKDFKNSIIKEGNIIQNYLQHQFWVFIMIFILSGITLIYLTIQSKKYHENILSLIKENEENLRYDKVTNTLTRAAFTEDEKRNKFFKSILIDINQFNKINSMIGYEGGDYVLKEIAEILKNFGEIYRVGPDKFVIIVDKKKDPVVIALEVLEKIQNLNIVYEGFSLPINVDMGITHISPMIKTAELAIRSNKTNNDVIHIYNESMDDSVSAKQNIEMLKKVNKALEENNIRPFFQPIVSLKSQQTVKYESLVRLMDGDHALSPFFFLDITKGSSTYQSITKTVLKKSMELVKQKNVAVSINISFEDIKDQNTINYINFFLMRNKEFSHMITFELLESEHISNFQIVENFIKMVKQYNCSIAIDDFGSGYSNFEYLFKLEPDIIKIDGSLIKNIHINKKSRIIVEAILNLAEKSNIQTVAEFVDNEKVDKIVSELGIDFAQGYYYSPPLDIL
jgi:diguanylate cyclase (GGDEF)-like protein